MEHMDHVAILSNAQSSSHLGPAFLVLCSSGEAVQKNQLFNPRSFELQDDFMSILGANLESHSFPQSRVSS